MNWMKTNSEKIKLALWSAIAGAIVLAIIGFSWFGWVTGGTAQQMAEEKAENAVVDHLTQICVAQFNQDPEKDKKLKKLKETDSWKRAEYATKQGWATMPGEKKPDSKVVEACIKELEKASQ